MHLKLALTQFPKWRKKSKASEYTAEKVGKKSIGVGVSEKKKIDAY